MLVLKNIYAETTPVVVDWEGNKINAEIHLNVVTGELLDSLAKESDFSFKLVAKVFKSIDVCLEDGSPRLEMSVETAKMLPQGLLDAMAETVQQTREEIKKKKLTTSQNI